MSVTPVVGPPRRGAFAVMPVVDYEPPTRNLPRFLSSSHALVQPPDPRPEVVGRAENEHPSEVASAPLSPQLRQAAVFADSALRRVLEVIDRRRPAAQLQPVLAGGLLDSALSVSRRGTASGAAVLRRLRLQPVVGADGAAEVFGTYSRGDRVHAIACRVERAPSSGRWTVVALHIG